MCIRDRPATTPVRPRTSARWVVTAVFFAFALGLGLWAGATPTLMQRTGLTASGLGLALTLHAATYVAAMTACGWLSRHIEPRRMLRVSLPLHALAFLLLFTAGSPLALTLGLVLVGATAGSTDLAMNSEGTAVERELGRPVLTRMHAAASAAFALGALLGSLLATGVGTIWCAALAVSVVPPVSWALWRLGPRAVALPPATTQAGPSGLPPGVLSLGAVLGLTVAAEITAAMWSSRYLAEQAAQLAAFAGAGAAFFTGSQAVVRFFGDPLRRRFGDHHLVIASLAVAACGFAFVGLFEGFAPALLGFALVGLGTACVVPCCFAMVAARSPQRAAAALGAASLLSGAVRLPTPLFLGAMATAWSDAAAFLCIAFGLVVALLLFALAGAAPRGPEQQRG
jgi:MFS family permease